MALDVHKLIAAISPDYYCQEIAKGEHIRAKVKKILAEKGRKGYAEAATIAALIDQEAMDLVAAQYWGIASRKALKRPLQRNYLIYDSFNEALEPVYYWMLDKMSEGEFKKVEKLIDNFQSAVGSGHFSEMGAKRTKMQEEGMKMLGAANTVVKSILNIIYDLKEFKLRLEIYDDYHSKDEAKNQAALLSLKQIWMDTVDMKKGTTSLKGLVQQFDYVTIIDAFMAARSLDDVMKPAEKGGLDLNERVRRILQQRVAEFYKWIEESERELRKRYDIEKTYLKSQVNTVKLYARWAKPYLKAAQQLDEGITTESPTISMSAASLVNAFNTTMLELVLMAEAPYDPEQTILEGDLPESFKKIKARKFSSILILEFRYRAIPERTQQGYGFRGRAEVRFTGYALNEDEIKQFRKEVEKDDLGDVFKLLEGATSESLEKMVDDIEKFLEEDGKKEEKKEEKKKEDTNPFSALFSLFTPAQEKEKKDDANKPIAPDTYVESILRAAVIIQARRRAYRLYDNFKKSRGMAAFPTYV